MGPRVPFSEVLEPSQSDQDRAQEEASVHIRPHDGDGDRPPQALRMLPPAGHEPQDGGEAHDTEELPTQLERARDEQERAGSQRQP